MKRKNYTDAFRTSIKVLLIFSIIAIIISLISKNQCNKKEIKEKTAFESERLEKYCSPLRQLKVVNENLPQNLLLTNTNSNNDQLKLKKLIIITRHGLRGSYYKQKHERKAHCDLKNEFLYNKFFTEFDLNEREMEIVHKYLHKSDQIKLNYEQLNLNYTENPIPENNHHCVNRHLSVPGAIQLIILGYRLGSTYLNQDHINLNSLDITTTDYLRTYQSAYAFVYGWQSAVSSMNEINLNQFKPDIKIATGSGSRMCVIEKYCGKCEKIDSIYQWILSYYLDYFNSRLTKHEHQAIENLIQLLPTPEMTEIYRHEPIELTMDGATTYSCHYEKYEKYCVKNYCLKTVDIDLVVKLCDQMYRAISDEKSFLVYNLLVIKGFIEKLKLDLISNSEKRVYIYSGNDATIIPILHSLSLYDGKNPQLATRLIFELYQDSSENEYLRIIYNGEDLTDKTSLCLNENEKENACLKYFHNQKWFSLIKLKYFLKFFNQLFIDVMKTDNFSDACQDNPNP